jgi:hypothetical protein
MFFLSFLPCHWLSGLGLYETGLIILLHPGLTLGRQCQAIRRMYKLDGRQGFVESIKASRCRRLEG